MADDEGAWDELIYKLRARLLTRHRGGRRRQRELPSSLGVVASQVGPWLASALEVSRLCAATNLGDEADGLWRAFFTSRRWGVARSRFGVGMTAEEVLAKLPPDVLAQAREPGSAATVVESATHLQRARRFSLLRRGWEGDLNRHFLGDPPRHFCGWERRRWRVFRAKGLTYGSSWVIEARSSRDGRRIWGQKLQSGQALQLEPLSLRALAKLNEDLKTRGVQNRVEKGWFFLTFVGS